MTTSDYLINGVFILIVLRQARERQLDTRSIVAPVAMMVLVGQQYLHSIPTAGNDPVLIGVLAAVGLGLGTLCGAATHVRAAEDGTARARVGLVAAVLLIAGIGSRMVFSVAISHGFEPAVAGFSVSHQITAAAWPVALVLMALCEVGARIAIVHLRGWRLSGSAARVAIPAAA